MDHPVPRPLIRHAQRGSSSSWPAESRPPKGRSPSSPPRRAPGRPPRTRRSIGCRRRNPGHARDRFRREALKAFRDATGEARPVEFVGFNPVNDVPIWIIREPLPALPCDFLPEGGGRVNAWITLHVEALDIGDESIPCAQCRGRTILVPLWPGGPTAQLDILAVERTGDEAIPHRLDVAPHDCAAGRARPARPGSPCWRRWPRGRGASARPRRRRRRRRKGVAHATRVPFYTAERRYFDWRGRLSLTDTVHAFGPIASGLRRGSNHRTEMERDAAAEPTHEIRVPAGLTAKLHRAEGETYLHVKGDRRGVSRLLQPPRRLQGGPPRRARAFALAARRVAAARGLPGRSRGGDGRGWWVILGIYASERRSPRRGRARHGPDRRELRPDRRGAVGRRRPAGRRAGPLHRALATIEAPDGWRVEGSPTGTGQVLAHPTRRGHRITPAVALLLAVAGREGFSVAS